MNFTESITTCFKKYADFNGCARRSEFWWFFLFLFVVGIVLQSSFMLSTIFTLGTLVPSLAAGARRLHDTNRSGWWQLLWLIPVIGWIVLIVFLAQEGTADSRYSTQSEAVPT